MERHDSNSPLRCDRSSRRQNRLEGDAFKASIASRGLMAFVFMAFVPASLLSGPLFAKGGSVRSEDRYNPHHIESLPPEIRDAVIRQCGSPRALHDFASYSEHLQKIVLHFEHFYCDVGDSFCGPSGCLHQLYVSSGGHYRLLRSYYAPAGN